MRLFREGSILAGFSDREDGDLWFPGMSAEALDSAWKKLCERIGMSLPVPFFVNQVHGSELRQIASNSRPGSQGEADGVFTDLGNVTLGVFTADCLPFLAAGKRWITAVHAGWKSTRLDISGKAVRELVGRGESAADLRGFIGPCIGSCCLELGDEVPPTFIERDAASAGAFSHGRKWHLDLRGLNIMQVMRAGLSADRVGHVHTCTKCGVDRYFSYRAEHGRQGSMFSFIVRLDESAQTGG